MRIQIHDVGESLNSFNPKNILSRHIITKLSNRREGQREKESEEKA
jgi:hypothetical protein